MQTRSMSTSSSDSSLQGSVPPLNLDEILSLFAEFQLSPSLPSSHVFLSNAYVDADDALESPPTNQRRRKHVKLLNGLALLLVTRRAHDVAAITLDQRLTDSILHTKFTVAKNNDWTPQEKGYHEQFLRLLKDTSLAKMDQRKKLGLLIVSRCRPKILDRVKKLGKAYKIWKELELEMENLDEKTLLSVRTFKSAVGRENDDRPWKAFFIAWFENRLAPKNFHDTARPEDCLTIILQTDVLCDCDGLLKSLREVPSLVRRFRKLAAYWKTIVRAVQESRDLQFKRAYSIEYVPSFKTPRIPSMEPPLTLLNRFVTAQNLKMATFVPGDVARGGVDLKKTNIMAGKAEQRGTIHCECGLALYLVSKENPRATIEIGISKRSCWPCLLFLHFLAERGNELMVASSHHKTYNKWAFPDVFGIDAEQVERIKKSLADVAAKKLKDWVRRTDKKRLSDSSQGSEQSVSSQGPYDTIQQLHLQDTSTSY